MSVTKENCFRLKYLHILETAGEPVLAYILKCGTEGKCPSVSLYDYLRNLPPTSTNNFTTMSNRAKTNYFSSTDMIQITNCTACDNFDITLACKAIVAACENVARRNDAKWDDPSDELEYLVTRIRKKRNFIIHEKLDINDDAAFYTCIEELKTLFLTTLQSTKVRYNRDESEVESKRREMIEAVDGIMMSNIGDEEILQRSATKMLPLLITEANEQLQDSLSRAKYLDPLRFLSGHENSHVDVQTLFSKIDMIDESHSETPGGIKHNVEYSKLINLNQVGGLSSSTAEERPKVLVIEGDAGTGKTTLLTFVLSEWLKDEEDRRMEGLDYYHIVLRVVCREDTSITLDKLMGQVLPEAKFKYGDLLLPLLNMCRILFLIDGLDERNTASRQLVRNILEEGRATAKYTLICTSRPEAVMDFKAIVPQTYQIFHVRIVGISSQERTGVVLKHYQWLMKDEAAGNNQELTKLMQEIGWMDIFRLPLNLVFLATMFFYYPTKINATIIQSQLYEFILTWSVEKLQDRLATDVSLPSRNDRQEKIETVLKVAYQIALKGLLQNRIYLTKEEKDLLCSSCSNVLPKEEIMQAFYTLRRDVTAGQTTERYCAPHKGLQEHFAAQHIIKELGEYQEGNIKLLLQNALEGQPLRLEPLRNMLIHLLGLLAQNEEYVTAIKETVDLIRASGVNNTCTWLSVLADTGNNAAILQRVGERIAELTFSVQQNDDPMLVTDGTISAAAALLPRLPERKVSVRLEKESSGLDTLLQALDGHGVVELMLTHHYVHPDPTTTDSGRFLQEIPQNQLEYFKGHLGPEHLSSLPQGIKHLSVSIGTSNHASTFLPALSDALQSLPHLYKLTIHVLVKEVIPAAVSRLPFTGANVCLTLSDVDRDQIEAAWRIAAAMCPTNKGYWDISFPGASLRMEDWLTLVNGLVAAAVKVVGTLYVPDTVIDSEEERQLCCHAISLMDCQLRRNSEEGLWR